MNKCEKSTLCFVYIKDSMIKGQNFNFDNKFKFKIVEENNSFILKIEKKEKKMPDNFFGENISNVTAIVGKNGAGKSRALFSIFSNISNGLTCFNGECYVYIYNYNDTYYVYSGNMSLNQRYSYKELDINLLFVNKSDDINNISQNIFFNNFVLFTNVFDVTYNPQNNNDDFSVDLSLNNEINNILQDNNRNLKDLLKYNVVKNIMEFVNSEMYYEIKNLHLESLPDLLRIRSIKKIKNNKYVSTEFMKNSDKFYHNHMVNKSVIVKRYVKNNIIDERSMYYEESLNLFAISYLLYLIDANQNGDLLIGEYICKLADTDKNGIDLLIELLDKYKIHNESKDIIYVINEIIRKQKQIILLWQRLDEFVIQINKENYENISYIIEIIYNDEKLKKYIDIDLQSTSNYETGIYSTGEFYRYRMFAKFYEFYNKLKSNNSSSKNILLLFDEIDVYYHPSLQTKVIYELIGFLCALFKEYNIQIIMTTNNPFILSDIPNDKIIYLDKAVIMERNTLTFGANIHSLLKENFYLESTRGYFCKEIINKVAIFLDNIDDKFSFTKEYCQYVIESVGEIIIRKKLIEMYNKKYSEEFESKYYRQNLKKEIDGLHDSLNNNLYMDNANLAKLNHLLKLTSKELDKLIGENKND